MKRLRGKTTSNDYNKIYKEKKRTSVDEIRWRHLLRFYKGGKILDAGCLDSKISIWAARLGNEAWGIDYAKKVIEDLQKKHQKIPNLTYSAQDVYKTQFVNNYFDYVVAGELIEHLDTPKRFIKEAFRILKPKGILAISTPCDEARDPGAVDAKHHVWSYDEQDMHDLLGKYGKVKTKILRTKDFPGERYVFRIILAWCKKQ